MEFEMIKTEGRGFIKAQDANGKWLYASKEQNNIDVFCPFCGCEMYLSHKGEFYYFAKKPGRNHCNIICQQIEKNGKYHSVEKTSFAELIQSLCHVSVSRGVEGDRSVIKSAKGEEMAESTVISVETRFTNLKQIYDYRLDQLKYQTDAEIREIKNYILYHEWARGVLFSNKGDLLNKIVYARLLYADDVQYMLHFSMYSSGWNCRFILRFTSLSEFKFYLNKLMKREQNANGSVGWKKKYENQTALIAAEYWEKLNEVQSKRMCGADKYYDQCIGVYMTQFYAKSQVYFPQSL